LPLGQVPALRPLLLPFLKARHMVIPRLALMQNTPVVMKAYRFLQWSPVRVQGLWVREMS
jgi:hypothetical protein